MSETESIRKVARMNARANAQFYRNCAVFHAARTIECIGTMDLPGFVEAAKQAARDATTADAWERAADARALAKEREADHA